MCGIYMKMLQQKKKLRENGGDKWIKNDKILSHWSWYSHMTTPTPTYTEIYYTIFSTLFNFDIFHNENITFFKTL